MEKAGHILWEISKTLNVVVVVVLLCLTLQQLLCGLEDAVGWGQIRKLAAGNEAGMNNAWEF